MTTTDPRKQQTPCDTHCSGVFPGTNPPPATSVGATPKHQASRVGPILRDLLLGIMAESLDDLEQVRIAAENRYRILTRTEADSDGGLRGFGLTDDLPEVAQQRALADSLAAAEHQAVRNLQRQVRKHPLWTNYASGQKGIGEKQFARLLAVIGDPYWNATADRPRRGPAELWAYCGMHVTQATGNSQETVDTHIGRAVSGSGSHPADHREDDDQIGIAGGVAPKRQRGQRSNWSEDARKRLSLISVSCLKGNGDLAKVYHVAREKYADAVHPAPCVRCGPAGHPAAAGTPLSAGHQHARALRIVSKTILKDLWIAARDIHEKAEQQ